MQASDLLISGSQTAAPSERRAAACLGARAFASKELRFGVDARTAMLAGVNDLADAVQVTMGPKGRVVLIEQPYGSPKITKDGVTVARSIEFSDRFKNSGASLVRQVCSTTNDVAGDGTTSAAVLTRAIMVEGLKSVAIGVNAAELRRGMSAAVDHVVTTLKSRAKMIDSRQEIAQVATISANGDHAVGELIATAMERVGRDGVITIQDGHALEDELEVVEGMRFDRGFISPYFMTDPKTSKCELEEPMVLIYDKRVSSMNQLLPALEIAVKAARPLVVVAEDVEQEALAGLVLNKLRGGLRVCAVKAPGFGENRKAILQDLAILTGGEVITEDLGMKLDQVTAEQMGGAKKITVTKDDTVVLDGKGDRATIEERCAQLQEGIARATSDYDKEKLQERHGKLSGGVAVLRVGGASEVEVGERKDRVVDALNATKAAVEEGIVPGGGAALLHASKGLAELRETMTSADERAGVDIIQRTLRKPCQTIIDNAGGEGAAVVGKLLETDDVNVGFNAATGQYADLVAEGVIDPLKVVRTSLVDACSVASLMTTTECVIVDGPQDKEPAGGGGGGMGGMGGGW